MLILKNIHKEYAAGDQRVAALRGISVEFRKNEFVSVLGPSGCGKTTLLNLIGGLDQYTSGDLVISGKSTKNFKDADWDAYRNHSIGFVFQSYNLIPHQTVLANVELALTISGISKAERRRRAKEALEKVGLASEIHKRPNQMSGGQMQRVAIARALVNNPEILLADEPTGALDSETSVQIMEMLKEVAKDRLVIMVTHNPELAETYSTRIIRMLDGRILGDTNPYTAPTEPEKKTEEKPKKEKRLKNRTMSFGTALSLSLNNLRTKKGRTLLTSFAGSIGIIGIALILAISNGVTAYINRVQEDTLSGYPLTIQAETVDMSSLITTMMSANTSATEQKHELDAVYGNRIMYELMSSLSNTTVQKNNLTAFKQYIESTPEFEEYASAIRYGYGMDMHIYTKDKNGDIIKSDLTAMMQELMAGGESSSDMMAANAGSFAAYQLWEEMLPGENGAIISPLFEEQYDLLYGHMPEKYNEVVLVIDANNELSDVALYILGLKTTEEMQASMIESMEGKTEVGVTESWSYEEICNMTFKMFLSSDLYQKNADGTYTNLSATEAGREFLYQSDRGVELVVSGIIRPNADAVASMLTGAIGYTSALTDHAIEKTAESAIIREQMENPEKDILTGLKFKNDDEAELTAAQKAAEILPYLQGLTAAQKAAIYTEIASVMPEDQLNAAAHQYVAGYTREALEAMVIAMYAEEMGISDTTQIAGYIASMSDEDLFGAVENVAKEQIAANYAAEMQANLGAMTADQLAMMLDGALPHMTEEQLAALYDSYMPKTFSDSTYERNLKTLGYVNADSPTSISIYAETFENKDEISALIAAYNASVDEVDKITYTDYVKLLMSSITTVINAISYVLIAFVSVSLVVSSIMIGIITYISVLERTKEIGILRAIGASKKDISRVFNAETAIVGFASGALGIGVTLLLILIANPILHAVTGIGILNAVLPIGGALILVALSIILTLISGLIPSRVAAKKDPVVALRTE